MQTTFESEECFAVSSVEEFLLTGADLCRLSSAVYVVLIRLRKFAVFHRGGPNGLNLQAYRQAWLHN